MLGLMSNRDLKITSFRPMNFEVYEVSYFTLEAERQGLYWGWSRPKTDLRQGNPLKHFGIAPGSEYK